MTSVKFSDGSLTLDVGEIFTFSPIVYPSTATNQEFTWESSNENVATVINGKVTAKEAGTTTIKARSKANSSAEATCKVTVKLPDGDNDGIPDKYDKEPDSIAILTIFSRPPGNGTSSETTKAGINAGHSFPTLKNITDENLEFGCITIPSGEELSFGTWDNKHKGIYYNFEAKELHFQPDKSAGRVSLSVPIGREQYDKILEFVFYGYNDTWTPNLNCASFACELWNRVVATISPLSPPPLTEYPLSDGVINLPYELVNSIKQYQNTKLYGYMNIYEFERDIKYSEEFTLEYLGYIESGQFINSSE